MSEQTKITGPQVTYNEATAGVAWSAIVHMVKALKQIDVLEVKRLANEKMKPTNDFERKQKAKVMTLLDNLHTFRESLKETGIPRAPEDFQQKGGERETPVGKQAAG